MRELNKNSFIVLVGRVITRQDFKLVSCFMFVFVALKFRHGKGILDVNMKNDHKQTMSRTLSNSIYSFIFLGKNKKYFPLVVISFSKWIVLLSFNGRKYAGQEDVDREAWVSKFCDSIVNISNMFLYLLVFWAANF